MSITTDIIKGTAKGGIYNPSSTKRSSILNYLFKEMGIPSNILEFEIAPLVDKVTDSEE